ncbi:MAG: hypothetical protein M1154_13985 [Gammaproteobacteria bacterium]|nr:hypothetical protein [Gammaproteobacteria bacterium]
MKTDHDANAVTHPEGQGQCLASRPVIADVVIVGESRTNLAHGTGR